MRALLEAGGDRRRTWTITPKTAAELPPALEALLVARIDRLEPGADGSRRWPRSSDGVPGLGRRRGRGQRDPDGDIAELLRAEIVREVRRFPELECTFRHGLLQEAALSTLTPTSQRELYGRVGHAMEAYLGDHVDERLDAAGVLLLSERRDRQGVRVSRAGRRARDEGRGARTSGGAVGARLAGWPSGWATGNAWSRSTEARVVAEAIERRAAAPARSARPGGEPSRAACGIGGGGGSGGDESRLPAANEIRCAYAVAVGGRFSGSFASACRIAHEEPFGRVGSVRARVRRLGVQVRAREVEHRLVGERRTARRAFVRRGSPARRCRRRRSPRSRGASRARGSRASPSPSPAW